MQQKNYLSQSALGVLLVVITLFVLYVIPEFDIGSFHFKRINIIADILKKEPKPRTDVHSETAKSIKPIFVDTCKTGITCIEDYTADTNGMTGFFTALALSKKQNVRIAWFGDSYVEGDIMLDPLRDSLQAIFGGSGVGFVPITSEVAGFRETIRHSFSNWETYSMVGNRDGGHPLGFGGYSVSPKNGNKVMYSPIKRKRLNQFAAVNIFYGNSAGGYLLVNGEKLKLSPSQKLSMLSIDRPMDALSLSVLDSTQTDLYGVSFEGYTGVAVDNFSMRGNSGIGLAYVNEGMYKSVDSLHHYNLIVLSYGLNVASEKAKNYTWYIKGMTNVIKMIKRAFPHSSILLVGCSDRAANINGEYQTLPMLKELIDVQRQMAIDNQICFWNLFEAMGGDSTMVNWANMERRPYANKDYTHLTFYGGRKVADILVGTLLYEKEKYDRKKKSR
jgi:hypothetical protein